MMAEPKTPEQQLRETEAAMDANAMAFGYAMLRRYDRSMAALKWVATPPYDVPADDPEVLKLLRSFAGDFRHELFRHHNHHVGAAKRADALRAAINELENSSKTGGERG